MDTEDRYRRYETARVRGELTVQDVWLRYLALSGNHDAFDIDGYLQGLLSLEASQELVLAVALNERLEEVHRAALVPLPTAPPEANGDAGRAVIEELLGRDWSRPLASDGTD
ncbi:MAG: hypothetical protein JWR62_323 [Modestobacter sp.]|jgi:hypothetical protein|nr:hypothetical protein [Modestobacter sp.]